MDISNILDMNVVNDTITLAKNNAATIIGVVGSLVASKLYKVANNKLRGYRIEDCSELVQYIDKAIGNELNPDDWQVSVFGIGNNNNITLHHIDSGIEICVRGRVTALGEARCERLARIGKRKANSPITVDISGMENSLDLDFSELEVYNKDGADFDYLYRKANEVLKMDGKRQIVKAKERDIANAEEAKKNKILAADVLKKNLAATSAKKA